MADFVKGIYVKKGKFSTKVSFNVEQFTLWLNENRNEKGYVNIDIKTAREDENKLYAVLDTWQPTQQAAPAPQQTTVTPAPVPADTTSDLPF